MEVNQSTRRRISQLLHAFPGRWRCLPRCSTLDIARMAQAFDSQDHCCFLLFAIRWQEILKIGENVV